MMLAVPHCTVTVWKYDLATVPFNSHKCNNVIIQNEHNGVIFVYQATTKFRGCQRKILEMDYRIIGRIIQLVMYCGMTFFTLVYSLKPNNRLSLLNLCFFYIENMNRALHNSFLNQSNHSIEGIASS